MQLRFHKIPTVDILIYDRVGAHYIKQCMPDDAKSIVLETRKRQVQIDYRILPYVASGLWRRFRKRNAFWARASVRVLYEYALLSVMNPKVVITYVDNSTRFNLLSRLYVQARFMGIQNGYRASEVEDMAKYLCLTELFCFGEETKANYLRYGCSIGKYYVIGSLKDGLYREHKQKVDQKALYDICFISQYRPARFNSSMPKLRDNTTILLEYTRRYCDERGKTFCIAGSCKKNEGHLEYDYYQQYFPDGNMYFVQNDEYEYSSYETIDKSEIAITINSTIGMESFGRGQKVLFCNLTDDRYYDLPDGATDGLWALNSGFENYSTFANRLSLLLEKTADQWWKEVKECAKYIMNADSKRLPQNVIASEILCTLNSRK